MNVPRLTRRVCAAGGISALCGWCCRCGEWSFGVDAGCCADGVDDAGGCADCAVDAMVGCGRRDGGGGDMFGKKKKVRRRGRNAVKVLIDVGSRYMIV